MRLGNSNCCLICLYKGRQVRASLQHQHLKKASNQTSRVNTRHFHYTNLVSSLQPQVSFCFFVNLTQNSDIINGEMDFINISLYASCNFPGKIKSKIRFVCLLNFPSFIVVSWRICSVSSCFSYTFRIMYNKTETKDPCNKYPKSM